MDIRIITTRETKEREASIKYWCNSSGELYNEGKRITKNDLPSELQTAYDNLWEEDSYWGLCYLVETVKGYGIALINDYDDIFIDKYNVSMTQLFTSAIYDAHTIASKPEFKDVEIFVNQHHPDYSIGHELITVFPYNITREELERASDVLRDHLFNSVKTMGKNKPSLESQIKDASVRRSFRIVNNSERQMDIIEK